MRFLAMNLPTANCSTLITWLWLALAALPSLQAQPAVSDLPRAEYYLARELFGAGRLPEATTGFEAAMNLARRVGQERWVDSIPPLVMLGECYYEQGNLAAALEHYDAALMLALANPGWIDQLSVGVEQLPPLENIPNGISWFTKSQPTVPVAIPEAIQISVDPTQLKVNPAGDVVAPVSLVTRLDAMEVLRTLGFAMLRRWQILGPLAPYSPLATPVERYFSQNPRQQAPWVANAWSVLRGFSQLGMGGAADNLTQIRRGILINGKFDYFMSPLALLTIAQIELRRGQYQAAIITLQDASLLAAQYEQQDVLAAAMTDLAASASASQRIDLLDPLQQAANWCAKRSLKAQLAALVGIAELSIYAGNIAQSESFLKQATGGLRLREVELPRLRAHAAYVAALQGFAQNRRTVGSSHLATALQLMHGSAQTGAVAVRVFQTQMTLNLLADGALTSRIAEDILIAVLAEPSEADWQNLPLETLATMTTASLPAYERWLELAAVRQAPDDILSRMDRLQRQKFYESLPLGGQLFSWRKAVASDPQLLPANILRALQRGAQRSPQLQTLPPQLNDLVAKLRNGPLPLDERQLPADAKKTFTQVQDLSEQLESALSLQCIARSTMTRYQLPAVNIPKLQQTLRPDDVALCFVVTNRQIFGAAITSGVLELWQIDQMDAVHNKLTQLLVEIGLVRQTANQSPSAVVNPSAPWRRTALELRDLLIPEVARQLIGNSKRLIVSPSAKLWYVPFELLPESDAFDATPWISQRAITYSPTLGSLSVAFSPGIAVRDTVGLLGSFFAPDRAFNDQQGDLLVNCIPNSHKVSLTQKITVPNSQWLGLRADQVWVASDIDNTAAGWEAMLIPLGNTRQIPLGKMLELPHVAPQRLLLPGLQTSLRNSPQLLDGDDIFLPACTLLNSGTRVALLSRWSAGGVSAERFLQRTLEEFDEVPAAQALRRSVLALWNEEFLTADEPILLPAGKDGATLISGRHPLLWSGYMAFGDTLPQ